MIGLFSGGNRYDIYFERLIDANAVGIFCQERRDRGMRCASTSSVSSIIAGTLRTIGSIFMTIGNSFVCGLMLCC
jgi:hypothetical protein